MSVAESRIVRVADFVKAVMKILSSGTKYQFRVRNVAVYRKSGYRVRVSRYRMYVVTVRVIICTVEFIG